MAIKVGLVQINNSFGNAHYLPYSVGCLQAYAQKKLQNPSDFEFLIPLYKRMSVDEAVEHLLPADIACFSIYVWNQNMSFAIARKLKERKPSILTVFGGPQVPKRFRSFPERAKIFLEKNPFIDMACHGEGEQVFVSVLENAFGDWSQIPSLSYFDERGNFKETAMAARMPQAEIAQAPSPYLEGLFGPLMQQYPGEWLVLWETNRGCPFSCAFCGWGGLVEAKVFKFDMERLKRELDWVAEHRIEFMFCADANFGIFHRDIEIARYAAEVKARWGYPQALSVQNAKNAEERIFQVQKVLADAGLNKGVTLAFQSRDPQTLLDIRRANISSEQFRNLQKRFTQAGIETYSDILLALPGETHDSFADGVAETIKDGQHNRIQFGNLSIVPDAEMSDPEYMERYGLKTEVVRAVTFHGAIHEPEWEIPEEEELVIETNTLSREDWIRTRVFCWMTSLLHFDKIFQIPLVVLNQATGVSYRKLLEVFTEGDLAGFPTLNEIRSFFIEKAKSIQRGEIEYCPAPEWLNIYWPVDEYIFIKLSRERKLGVFYREAAEALRVFLEREEIILPDNLLREAIRLNLALIKIPDAAGDLQLTLSYNIWEFYRGVLEMRDVELVQGSFTYRIDRTTKRWGSWDEWCREVVWFGNKKGAYLYGNTPVPQERAGHF